MATHTINTHTYTHMHACAVIHTLHYKHTHTQTSIPAYTQTQGHRDEYRVLSTAITDSLH